MTEHTQVAPAAGAASPTALRALFVHLWTRLDEATWRLRMVAGRDEPFSQDTRNTLRNIAGMCDPKAAHDSMTRLLAEHASRERTESDRLRDELKATHRHLAAVQADLDAAVETMERQRRELGKLRAARALLEVRS